MTKGLKQPLRPSDSLSEYRIGPGDVLQVSVWKEPDASVAETIVRTDGKISLPLIKEVEVSNLTPHELEKKLAEKYATLIRAAPEVTVLVKEIHSQKIYLVGAVRKEGPLRLQAPTTVLQALAEAGGLTEWAKKSKIYLLRTANNKQMRIPFDYKAVIRGENLEQNVLVQPGDTIVVPQ